MSVDEKVEDPTHEEQLKRGLQFRMKLYDFSLAPNPRRVRMFLAEKGVDIPSVQVNTREREQFNDCFLKINPYAQVPVLELDDGTYLAESVAICRYIEEIHPQPPLMGRNAKDKAIVEMWNRRAEFEGYLSAAAVVRNSLPIFADRGLPGLASGVPQIPALAERSRKNFNRFLKHIDQQLENEIFLAGDTFTIADITAFVAIEFAKVVDLFVPEDCRNVGRWHRQISERRSAAA